MALLPHPIPYQGSKRLLATTILSTVRGLRFGRLYEPFAGSAAFTLAAADYGIAEEYVISDALTPLMEIWRRIVSEPEILADEYQDIWRGQLDSEDHYGLIRDRFNARGGAAELLYLLARCVKNAPRFNRSGQFNQSADLRRRGMRPSKMRQQILGSAALLRNNTTVQAADYHDALAEATAGDLVYMDPPYEGTTTGIDRRYFQQVERERLIRTLTNLNEREIPFLLSYDGRHGDKTYGEPLPDYLRLELKEIVAGRSSQATLSGRNVVTIESLYVSESLQRLFRKQGKADPVLTLFNKSIATT